MKKTIPNLIIKPDTYPGKPAGYPVLYLLHGATGDHTDWVTKAPIVKSLADQYDLLIVCPNGDSTSWYFDSPVDSAMRYETYVSKELVEQIDAHYKTRNDKKHRAITGLSMGGHGALYLAFRHPDLFGAAGSMSGGVDIRPFADRWDIAKRLGSYSRFPENWEKNTVTNLLPLLDGKSLRIIVDCGVEDFFFPMNKALHQKMAERNIAHDYIERPGSHTWEYWQNAVKYQVLFFDGFFRAQP